MNAMGFSIFFYGDDLPVHELAEKLNVEPILIDIKDEHRNNIPKYSIAPETRR